MNPRIKLKFWTRLALLWEYVRDGHYPYPIRTFLGLRKEQMVAERIGHEEFLDMTQREFLNYEI